MCWSHQALVSVWVPARLRHADSAGACPRNTRSGNWAVSGNPPARISSLGLALASEPGASLAPGGRLRGEHCRIAVSSALNALISHAISSCPLIAGPPRAFDALGGCRNEKVSRTCILPPPLPCTYFQGRDVPDPRSDVDFPAFIFGGRILMHLRAVIRTECSALGKAGLGKRGRPR